MTKKNLQSGMTSAERDKLLSSISGSGKPLRREAPKAQMSDAFSNDLRTDFGALPAYEQLKMQRAAADIIGIENPFFKSHEGCPADTTVINGKELINFASYNYLGLNGHPDVIKATIKALEVYGSSSSGSRLVGGERPLHRELEKELAEFYQTEDALVFVSGYLTNVASINELMGSNDLILHDAMMHNSALMGAELSGAARRNFPHNDYEALDDILHQHRDKYERVLILVEGLYSMDGDYPDLRHFVEVKERHSAWLMVDEAHSLGVLGETGHGISEHWGVDPTLVDIWMGTLSKTLVGCGGFIAGKRQLIENLKFNARSFVYSVGLAPPLAAASLEALHLIGQEPERVKRVQRNGQLFQQLAEEAGLNIGTSAGSAVGSIIVGDSLRAAKLVEKLHQRGFSVLPILHPAVPEKTARLRFFLTSEHTTEQLRAVITATAEELKKLEEADFGINTALSAID